MGRLAGIVALGWAGLLGDAAHAEVRVASDAVVETVVAGVPRPVELAFDAAGRLVILSHGWRGDAAGEVYRIDLGGRLPFEAALAPRIVLPFATGPRKTALGSMALDPRGGDLFLGEENGNRILRLTPDERLETFAVGLHHLLGGSSLGFDQEGRLVVLDFTSAEARRRAETPVVPELEWLQGEAYDGPLVFRVDPRVTAAGPRRLDLAPPLFPRVTLRRVAGELALRFVSVIALGPEELLLLDVLGQVHRLIGGSLRLMARLPAGHYHRTHMAVGTDGSLFVSAGFHIREVFRVTPTGAVSRVAWDLGDPQGLATDPSGALYVAESALHRVIRIRPR